jgi:membrane-bound serine protease (ClpP class)
MQALRARRPVWIAGAMLVLAAALAVPARAEVPVVELSGVVHAVSAAHVTAALDAAEKAGAPVVILRLDTPGGLDSSMRQIVDRVLSCRVPVVVYVGPSGARAASAGFVIALAADLVAMAPGTNMGAAHPVSTSGEMGEVMSKKVTEDAAAYVRGKAERRHRNVEMAEKAVTESRSFTEREAVDLHLADLVASSVPELLRALDGREVTRFDQSTVRLSLAGQTPVTVAMGWRQRVLSLIASPETLFLLLLGALAGIGAEISHPGALFPGLVGTISLILFLFASQVLPVNWAGVLLIVLAVGLFAAEAKVHSYGLLTVGGIASMILGAMMLVDGPIPEMRVPLRTVVPAVVVMAAGAMAIVRLVLESQKRTPTTGEEGLLGAIGTAETDIPAEGGWVRVAGERWHGTADGPVEAGQKVRVTAVDGLTVRLRKES